MATQVEMQLAPRAAMLAHILDFFRRDASITRITLLTAPVSSAHFAQVNFRKRAAIDFPADRDAQMLLILHR